MATSGSVNTNSYDGRYYQVSWTATQNVANNTSTISWTLKALGGNSSWYAERTLKVVIAGETVYSKSDRVERWEGDVKSGSKTITHDSDGTKSFSISVQAAVVGSSVNCTGSKSFALDTIARKSSLSASSGTLGSRLTLSVSKQSSNFTHTITYKCGSASGTICTKVSDTTVYWDTSNGNTVNLSSQNTTGTSVSVTFTITTYNGSTSLGTNTKTVLMSIPASVKPSCTVTVKDTEGFKTTYGKPIKGLSKLEITVNPTTSQGSSISSYRVSVNGAVYTTKTSTTDVLKNSGNITISAQVTDKRGRTGKTEVTESVYDYTPPQISKLAVKRCNADGTENNQGQYVQATFNSKVTSLDGKNSAAYILHYKKSSETSYTGENFGDEDTHGYEVTDGTYIFRADTESSYDVRLEVTDDFQTVYHVTSASTAHTIMDFGKDGKSIGFGKVAEKENTVGFGFDASFDGNVYGRAYGLGGLPEIPVTDDLNNYTEPGCWCIPTNANASTMMSSNKNVPIGYAGRLIVENSTGWDDPGTEFKYRLQTYIPYLTIYPTMVRYIRKTSASSWIYQEWKTLSYPTKDITFTAESGITVTRCTVSRYGDIVTMCFSGKCSSAINAGTTKKIGTVTDGLPQKSVVTCGLQGNAVAACWVTNAGVVNIRPVAAAYTANAVIEFNLTWNVTATWP